MHPIHYVGIFTTLLLGAGYLVLVRKRVPSEERQFLLGLAALTFLLPGLAYYAIRLPLDGWLRTALDPQGASYAFLRAWYAPVTEELAKIWPLLLPGVARWITAERAPRAAYALGLGFGIGEVAFLAVVFGLDPAAEQQKWYYYSGFLAERMLVAPCHALFTLVALCAWRRWHWPGGLLTGLAGAATLHFLLNGPIFLKMKGWLGGETLSGQLLYAWIFLFFIVTMTAFARTFSGKPASAGGFLFGETNCVLCGVRYERPFWALNLGPKRYEKCPSCLQWHLQP